MRCQEGEEDDPPLVPRLDHMSSIIEATNLHTEMAQKPLDYEQLQHFFGLGACGETKIMLQLEIQEGKVPMQEKKEYWSGSDRMVVADSAFASLKTAEALHKHGGLCFIGLVKTAHK
eukprot:Em0009g320a